MQFRNQAQAAYPYEFIQDCELKDGRGFHVAPDAFVRGCAQSAQ